MENFKLDHLELRYGEEGNGLIMSWLGKSNFPNPSEILMPYFLENIEKWKGKGMTLDFRGLEYMNSSTVSLVIQLIKKLDDACIDTLVVYEKNLRWQALSFQALESIENLFKNVRIEGK